MVAHPGLDVCVGWQLQGQLVVGLPGEARQFPRLICEEKLTLSPCAVVWEGLIGQEHLERDKGSVGALCLSFPGAAQRKGAASSPGDTGSLARSGSPFGPCPAAVRPTLYYFHRMFIFCSLPTYQVWG